MNTQMDYNKANADTIGKIAENLETLNNSISEITKNQLNSLDQKGNIKLYTNTNINTIRVNSVSRYNKNDICKQDEFISIIMYLYITL